MAGGNTGKNDVEDGAKRSEKEQFRFRDWKLAAISGLVAMVGLAVFERIWDAAVKTGLLTVEASGEDYSRAQSNLVIIAALLAGTFLLSTGVVLLFAEVKSVTVDATEKTETAEPAEEGGQRRSLLWAAGAVKITEATALGLGKLRGGVSAIFAGIVLFAVAAGIATASIVDTAEESEEPSSSAPAASPSSTADPSPATE